MADKELASVRAEFVEKASTNLVEDLLDLLLKDGVLNDGQKDSILEENRSRANKARALVDIVKRKGDKASRKMIAHLQSKDPCLYSELGLSSGPPAQSSGPPAQSSGPPAQSSGPPAQSSGPPAQSSGPPAQSSGPPAQPAAEQQMDQVWSNTLIPTSEAFWSEKQNDRNIYPADKNCIRNRVALLITNIKFTDKKYNRNGAEKDEESTEKLLTALGYEVVKHTNLTGKAINDAIIEFSKHPKLKKTDSVLLVIMSHGKLGVVLGVDWKNDDAERPDEFPINNIYKHLGPEKCPALLNKPKIIIIQACRGEGDGSVLIRDAPHPDVVCDNAGEENIEEDSLQYVNKEKDFISLLSCTPDTPSFRHQLHGSFLILYIADVLNTFAHQDDIEELFRKVMQRFEEFRHPNKRQMASKDRCTLTKRFYFFPGL